MQPRRRKRREERRRARPHRRSRRTAAARLVPGKARNVVVPCMADFIPARKALPLRSKVAAIITVFLFGVGLLVFIMVQMQNYASIINDAGSVRGATQRAVKLEIADMPNEDVVEHVDEVLASLIDREDQRPLKSRETREFEDALFRIEDEWGLIKQEFAEPSPSEERLLALSEEHFRLADTTVFLAQRRAESDFLWIAAVGKPAHMRRVPVRLAVGAPSPPEAQKGARHRPAHRRPQPVLVRGGGPKARAGRRGRGVPRGLQQRRRLPLCQRVVRTHGGRRGHPHAQRAVRKGLRPRRAE